jgi:hypothetical protein
MAEGFVVSVRSCLARFGDEFEAHISNGGCRGAAA